MTMGVEELEALWKIYNNEALVKPDYHLDILIIDLSHVAIVKFPLDVPELVQASCIKLIVNSLLNDELPVYDTIELMVDLLEEEYKICMVIDYHAMIRYIETIEPIIHKCVDKYINRDEVVMLAKGDVVELENKEKCIWLSDIHSVLQGDRCMLNTIFKVYTKRGTL